jgi:transcriptional regulator CtsR
MARLSDAIEAYLRLLLETNEAIELQRSDLAQRFRCVPSQINYVLATRFTPERGYLVESRRGGGGYVRIIRLNLKHMRDLHELVHQQIGEVLTQDEAFGIVDRLMEQGWLTDREAAIIRSALDRDVLRLDVPVRDALRANLLRAMLLARIRHG